MSLDEDVGQEIEYLQLVLIAKRKGSELKMLIDIRRARPQKIVDYQLHHVLADIRCFRRYRGIDELKKTE